MSKKQSIKITQVWSNNLQTSASSDLAVANYRYESDLPKPCFHPLTTAGGALLSGYEMSDHIWHRGLWFTIKYVNDTNFWEEEELFGKQVSVREPEAKFLSENSVQIHHELHWTEPSGKVVIKEDRMMVISRLENGVQKIDWSSQLEALEDLKLDRTPFTTWGGYGGMSFRASRELHDAVFHLPTGEYVNALTGQAHDWVILEGKMDGGRQKNISIAMVDHPANPRNPSPWYGKTAGGFTFINAAFLFHQKMDLKEKQTIRFKYGIYYRDGAWNTEDFSALAKSYREELS